MKKIILLLVFVSGSAYCDNIMGPVKKIIDSKVMKNSSVIELEISPEEIFSIIPDYKNLPDIISIEIRSSDLIKQFRDSFSLYSYSNIIPFPVLETKSYTGKYINSHLIPDRTRFFIDIIFNKNINKQRVPGTKIIDLIEQKDEKPLMFSILPVMKGVPDYLFLEKFKIKIIPQWAETGNINLKVSYLSSDNKKIETESYKIYINDKEFNTQPDIILKTGIHKITVIKEGFISFEENITLKTNENRVVKVILKKNRPEITIFSPKESVLFIDGIKQERKKITEIDEGEHTILFKLGEYSMSRKITIENGKKYIINLLLDIEIKEK